MHLQRHVGSYKSQEEARQARMNVALRTGHPDAELLYDSNPYARRHVTVCASAAIKHATS